MRSRRAKITGVAAAALLAISSCVSMSEIDSLSEIGGGEVVIVGKIVLDPPLQKHEQNLSWSMEQYRNQVVFLIDDRPHDPARVGIGELSLMQRADLGALFYAKVPRAAVLHYSAPRVALDAENMMDLPGGLEIAVPAGSRLLYFGTLIYKRDVYSAVTGVELRDELASARAEVAARLGPQERAHAGGRAADRQADPVAGPAGACRTCRVPARPAAAGKCGGGGPRPR